MITETSPGVIVTRVVYDSNENPILVTQPKGNSVATAYDERDLIYTVTRGFGTELASTTTTHYDLNGNPTYGVDAFKNNTTKNPVFPAGDVTQLLYDGFDRRVGAIDAELGRSDSVFDPAGYRVRIIVFGPPEEGNPRIKESSIFYDEAGRPFLTDAFAFPYTPESTGRTLTRTIPIYTTTPPSGEELAQGIREFDALGRTVRKL